MSTVARMRSARKWIVGGIATGYVMPILAMAFEAQKPRVAITWWGMASPLAHLVILAIPPTMAVLALKGRPRLLPYAAALEAAFGFWFLLPLMSAILIFRGSLLWPRPVRLRSPQAAFLAGVLAFALAAYFAPIARLDPVCVTTSASGATTVVTGAATGFPTGWVWNKAPERHVERGAGPVPAVKSTCSSNVVTGAEATATILFALSALAVAYAAKRPVTVAVRAPEPSAA